MSKLIKDIDKALLSYPSLTRVEEGDFIRVKGTIPLTHSKQGEFDRYEVLIKFPVKYPKCFPRVIETSMKIPRIADRHVNSDNTLCLAVEPEEQSITKNGITFLFFIEKVLIPHLARETYRSAKGVYPEGEYSHGHEGIWEYFESSMNQKDRKKIVSELEEILNNPWPGRNDLCSCGSGKKFKKCHMIRWSQILKPGKSYLTEQLQLLKANIDYE